MDKKLQKKILEVIKAQGGETSAPILRQKVVKGYWHVDEPTDEQQKSYLHQLKLLELEEKVIKDQRTASVYYVMTSTGYRVLAPWIERAKYFLLYDKHNLFIILAFLVSIASLILSFHALKKDTKPHGDRDYFLNETNKGV